MPIPDDQKCDHLFLLVGTNPLPNWVAAKLLLNQGGRIHLFCTPGTRKYATRLKDVLEKQDNLPVSLYETADADEMKIRSDIERQAQKLIPNKDKKIGLNYTGGTKMMSVHAHRAINDCGFSAPIMSYLDARSLRLKFDGKPDGGWAMDSPELLPIVSISLEMLLQLHDEYRDFQNDVKYDRQAKSPSAAYGLVNMHSHYSGQRQWRLWCDALGLGRTNHDRLKKEDPSKYQAEVSRLNSVTLLTENSFRQKVEANLNQQNLSPPEVQRHLQTILGGYVKMLAELRVKGGDNLQTLVANNSSDYKDSVAVAKWLDGMWLEHYTLQQIEASKVQFNPYGLAINLETLNKERRRFEADVIALRGYQLFYFTCYTGNEFDRAKMKLFEAVERSAQLGGDEAKVALICNSDKPRFVRQECEADWERSRQNQIEVFGRQDLPNLAGKLNEWFTRKPQGA